MPNYLSRFCAALGTVALASCGGSSPTAPSASVNFVLVAPLCSSILQVPFSIDSQLVATDTFRVAISPVHTTSRDFPVSPGQHILSARITGAFGNGYVWPDRAVNAMAGAVVADSLPMYCS
ncbi:MAG: hypothetical protein ABJE47_18505 [bacterium]